MRHEYIGTEHLALALAAQTEGGATTALRSLHIGTDGVRRTIVETVRAGTASSATGKELPYTSRTYKIFELAAATAQAFGQVEVGAEHLLHGLLWERLGIGAGACVFVEVGQ